jgi:hypothetical protein
MKRHINLIMVLVLGFILTACSGRMVQLPTENTKAKQVPAWYLDHADTGKEGWVLRKGYYYAVAVAVSPDMEMSQKKAVLKAKAKITDRINGEMNNKTSINYTEKGAPESMTGVVESQDVIVNMIKQTVLRTYSVEKKLTMYNTDKNNYRSFVLMKISKKDVDGIIDLVEDKNSKKLASKITSNINKTSDTYSTRLL